MKVMDTIAAIAAGMALAATALRIADQVAVLHARPSESITRPAPFNRHQLLGGG